MTEVWCFIICFSYRVPESLPVDSFCQTYKQVVLSQIEVEQVKKLSSALQRRLQENELEYLCRCRGAKLFACETK